MKSLVYSTLGLALAVGLLSGCSGSDNPPIVSSGSTAAAVDDRNVPQSDQLTSQEVTQVNQANAEPVPPQKPDM